jgi:hypothetical protein
MFSSLLEFRNLSGILKKYQKFNNIRNFQEFHQKTSGVLRIFRIFSEKNDDWTPWFFKKLLSHPPLKTQQF